MGVVWVWWVWALGGEAVVSGEGGVVVVVVVDDDVVVVVVGGDGVGLAILVDNAFDSRGLMSGGGPSAAAKSERFMSSD